MDITGELLDWEWDEDMIGIARVEINVKFCGFQHFLKRITFLGI